MILKKSSRDRVINTGPAPTWGAAPKEQAHMIYDRGETFATPNKKDHSKSINSNPFNVHSMDVDAGISLVMAKKLQQLRQMISCLPGVVQPIPEV